MADKAEAERLFATILAHLPKNNTGVFAEILLPTSNCLMYLPLRKEQLDNKHKVKDLYQDLANKARL